MRTHPKARKAAYTRARLTSTFVLCVVTFKKSTIMRKYRFAASNSKWSQIRPKLNTLYFFLTWNIAGYAIYKFIKYKAGQKVEGFNELSPAEQHMHVMGTKPHKKITIRGLHYEKIEPYQAFEPKQKTEPAREPT